MDILIQIKNTPSLKSVSEMSKSLMAEKGILKIYDEDKILFLEGKEEAHIYLILEGKAFVSKFSEEGDEKIIHILQKGDFINEFCIDGRKTSTTVTAKEGAILLKYHKKDILKWMEQDFSLSMALFTSLSIKLRKTYRQIRNLGLKKIHSRVASRLWKLSRDYGCKEDECISIDLDLTQSQLASMVGTTRESISRFLKKLEREKIIIQKNQKISILNLRELEKYIDKSKS